MKKTAKRKRKQKRFSTATLAKVRKKWPGSGVGFLPNETRAIEVPCPKCGSRNLAIVFDTICGPSSGECLDCGYGNGIFTFAKDALECWNAWLYSLMGPCLSHDHPQAVEHQKDTQEGEKP